jgi:hypothetical protein
MRNITLGNPQKSVPLTSFFTDPYIRGRVWGALTGLTLAVVFLNYVVLQLYALNRDQYLIVEPLILDELKLSPEIRANQQQSEEIVRYYFSRWEKYKYLASELNSSGFESSIFGRINITPAFGYLDMSFESWQHQVELGNFDLLLPLAFLYSEMNWWQEHNQLIQKYHAVVGYTYDAYTVMAESQASDEKTKLLFRTLLWPGEADEPVKREQSAIDMLDKHAILTHLNKITPDGRLTQRYLAFIDEQKKLRDKYINTFHLINLSEVMKKRMQRWQAYLSQFD